MTRNINELSMAELVEQYNKATAEKGINPVKKFSDMKTGRSRLFAVLKSETVDMPAVEKKDNVVPLRPAKEKKAVTEKPAKEKKAKANGADHDEFGVRVGSNRNKLFNLLKKTPGKPVDVKKCVEAVYGKGGSLGPLAGVIKGCELSAPDGHGKLTKEGKGENMTLTLTLK